MSLGNYYYLTEENVEPHAVANYFKKILYSMSEPLCTFKLYPKFKTISETP